MEAITVAALVASVVVGVLQKLISAVAEKKGKSRGETPTQERAIETDQLTTDLADLARKPDATPDVRLGAGLAAIAVSQLKPKAESKLKTYIWPLVIATVGIFAPIVDHLAGVVDPQPADCTSYLQSVKLLPEIATDAEGLKQLATSFQPDDERSIKHCGGTPAEILTKAGKIR